MSSEIFDYLLANRHDTLLNIRASMIANFMKNYTNAYDFQSLVRIHIGNIPENPDDDKIKYIHLMIITDYKLFMTIKIRLVDFYDEGPYYDIVNELLFVCDENIANRAIEYLSDNNYVFNYHDVLKNTGLVPVGDGSIYAVTFADFMPRIIKSGYSSTKSSRS